MAIGNIITIDDLNKITDLLIENNYGAYGITISIPVRSKEILSRINDDFYYRNNGEGTPPDVEEINVEISGIKFRYYINEN